MRLHAWNCVMPTASTKTGLGKKLQAAVEFTFQKIKANPGTGRVAPHGMRRCLVPDFPYYIIFENQDDYIYMFAVAHLRRDPDYWVDRLPGT